MRGPDPYYQGYDYQVVALSYRDLLGTPNPRNVCNLIQEHSIGSGNFPEAPLFGFRVTQDGSQRWSRIQKYPWHAKTPLVIPPFGSKQVVLDR